MHQFEKKARIEANKIISSGPISLTNEIVMEQDRKLNLNDDMENWKDLKYKLVRSRWKNVHIKQDKPRVPLEIEKVIGQQIETIFTPGFDSVDFTRPEKGRRRTAKKKTSSGPSNRGQGSRSNRQRRSGSGAKSRPRQGRNRSTQNTDQESGGSGDKKRRRPSGSGKPVRRKRSSRSSSNTSSR